MVAVLHSVDVGSTKRLANGRDTMSNTNAVKIQYSINEMREYMWSAATYFVFVDGQRVDRVWYCFQEALAWCHEQPAYKA